MWRSVMLGMMLVALAPQTGTACSFATGYRQFAAGDAVASEAATPPKTPNLSVVSLRRGQDDGNFASCSDAGILTIAVDEPEAVKDLGFIFHTESGSFPDVVFPDYAVSPIDLRDGSWGFFFVWLDLPAGRTKVDPIDAKVSVQAVSPSGVRGEKVFLDIRNP